MHWRAFRKYNCSDIWQVGLLVLLSSLEPQVNQEKSVELSDLSWQVYGVFLDEELKSGREQFTQTGSDIFANVQTCILVPGPVIDEWIRKYGKTNKQTKIKKHCK